MCTYFRHHKCARQQTRARAQEREVERQRDRERTVEAVVGKLRDSQTEGARAPAVFMHPLLNCRAVTEMHSSDHQLTQCRLMQAGASNTSRSEGLVAAARPNGPKEGQGPLD
jgi:hypothetical protein